MEKLDSADSKKCEKVSHWFPHNIYVFCLLLLLIFYIKILRKKEVTPIQIPDVPYYELTDYTDVFTCQKHKEINPCRDRSWSSLEKLPLIYREYIFILYISLNKTK